MSDSIPKDLSVVLCDMCTEEEPKPAKKTCMKCEISMCVQHLQAHLTTPVLLQTHPLTEPMALCGTSKCLLHGKLLEYYCLDDLTCVCVSCAIEDQHRLHNMKTFSSAHKELMEKLSSEHQALLVKTDDDNVSLEKWEKSEREKLGRCSVRLIEAVSSLRDVVLTSVQSSVSARMVSLKTSKSSMQAAQSEKDAFRFLQMYSQVHEDVEKAKAADLRKGLEPGSDRDKLVEELRQGGEKIVEQADQFWCSLLTHVDPENHQQFFNTGSELIFDPQIWTPAMSLSEDNRKVFYSSGMGQCNATLLIRSPKSVANFQRWMVNLSEECDWTIGICDEQSVNNLEKGPIYGLSCKGDQVSFLKTDYDDCCDRSASAGLLKGKKTDTTTTEKQHIVTSGLITYDGENDDEPITRPEIVEVYWNFVDSSLAFFSRPGQHQREEIISIEISLNSWDLVPFVQLKREEKSQSCSSRSAVMVRNSCSVQCDQKQWQCSCGLVYTERNDGYECGGKIYKKSTKCMNCCGIIGSHRTTMMLCEFL